MNKSDLKTGMIVTLRDRTKYMVLLNSRVIACDGIDILLNDTKCIVLSRYQDDLRFAADSKYDIIEVELNTLTMECTETIWRRKDFTPEELQQIAALKIIYPEARYAARDYNGELHLYGKYPQRVMECWASAYDNAFKRLPDELLPSVRWTDAEPFVL